MQHYNSCSYILVKEELDTKRTKLVFCINQTGMSGYHRVV